MNFSVSAVDLRRPQKLESPKMHRDRNKQSAPLSGSTDHYSLPLLSVSVKAIDLTVSLAGDLFGSFPVTKYLGI